MPKSVVCYGEVLWDVFPDSRVAGGAPMNVAIRLQSLGVDATVVSRVGRDAAGTALRELIGAHGVDTGLIQDDAVLPTGEVLVSLDGDGNASFDIVWPVAWDRIDLVEQAAQAVARADAFVHGSLACRDEVSRGTLLALLGHARYRVFDVNLRPPHSGADVVETLMRKADLIKLNHDELDAIASAAGGPGGAIAERMRWLADRTGAQGVCVTRGGDGAMLLLGERVHACGGFQVEVADTVGAGDSFLAALLAGLLDAQDPDLALAFACRVGAAVAARRGANPRVSAAELARLRPR